MKLEAAKKAEANQALDPPPTKVAEPQAPNPEPRQYDNSNAAMPLGTKGGRVSFEDDALQTQPQKQSYGPKKRKAPNSSVNEQQQAVQQQR